MMPTSTKLLSEVSNSSHYMEPTRRRLLQFDLLNSTLTGAPPPLPPPPEAGPKLNVKLEPWAGGREVGDNLPTAEMTSVSEKERATKEA